MDNKDDGFIEELKKLNELNKSGAITDEEFRLEKSKLLEQKEVGVHKGKNNVRKPNSNIISLVTKFSLWVISLFILIFSLSGFTFNILAGLLMLISALIISPPIRKLYLRKFNIRLRYVLIISTILFFSGIIAIPSQGYTTPGSELTDTKRVIPEISELISENPEFLISYDCVNVQSITIENTLSQEDIEKICNNGYELSLKNGQNEFTVKIVSVKGEIIETIKVSFDEAEYNKVLEERALEEENKKLVAKAAAEEKAAAEARAQEEARVAEEAKAAEEARAVAEAREALLKDYASKYCVSRKDTTRTFGELILYEDGSWENKVSKAKTGKNLREVDCRNIINFLVSNNSSDSAIEKIADFKFWIGMNDYELAASMGNPNKINETGTVYGSSNQWIYYKDNYGISAFYFYVENGVVSSYQDF